jgi:hypothetical protein
VLRFASPMSQVNERDLTQCSEISERRGEFETITISPEEVKRRSHRATEPSQSATVTAERLGYRFGLSVARLLNRRPGTAESTTPHPDSAVPSAHPISNIAGGSTSLKITHVIERTDAVENGREPGHPGYKTLTGRNILRPERMLRPIAEPPTLVNVGIPTIRQSPIIAGPIATILGIGPDVPFVRTILRNVIGVFQAEMLVSGLSLVALLSSNNLSDPLHLGSAIISLASPLIEIALLPLLGPVLAELALALVGIGLFALIRTRRRRTQQRTEFFSAARSAVSAPPLAAGV